MATISELNVAERIVLPFAALIPVAMGVVGYVVWKRDTKRMIHESMTDKMRVFFVANSAALCSMTVFHVLHTLFSAYDYRWGMGAFAAMLVFCFCLGIRFEALRIFDDDDILLNQHNETASFVMFEGDNTAETVPDTNDAIRNDVTRKYIAVATYLALLVQSGFDGLILKYNPNAQSSATQVVMFFLSKLLESIIISTALIHARVQTKWYVLCMLNYTIAVALSTLPAYDLVESVVIVIVFEHPVFLCVIGASGGLLLYLSYYYVQLEHNRIQKVNKSSVPLIACYTATFALGAITGMYG